MTKSKCSSWRRVLRTNLFLALERSQQSFLPSSLCVWVSFYGAAVKRGVDPVILHHFVIWQALLCIMLLLVPRRTTTASRCVITACREQPDGASDTRLRIYGSAWFMDPCCSVSVGVSSLLTLSVCVWGGGWWSGERGAQPWGRGDGVRSYCPRSSTKQLLPAASWW